MKELKLRDRKRDSSGFRCCISCLIYLYIYSYCLFQFLKINGYIYLCEIFCVACSLLCTGSETLCNRTAQNATQKRNTKEHIEMETSALRKIKVFETDLNYFISSICKK